MTEKRGGVKERESNGGKHRERVSRAQLLYNHIREAVITP